LGVAGKEDGGMLSPSGGVGRAGRLRRGGGGGGGPPPPYIRKSHEEPCKTKKTKKKKQTLEPSISLSANQKKRLHRFIRQTRLQVKTGNPKVRKPIIKGGKL